MGIAITVYVEDRLYDEVFLLKKSSSPNTPMYLWDDL